MLPGLLRFEKGIEIHEEVILMTTKGEAIALAYAQMSAVEMTSCDHGVVAKIKRVIMERDLYPRRWGMGPVATEKKKMKEAGTLDKFGRPNEKTPAKWNAEYKDLNRTDVESAPLAETTSTAEVLAAPPVAPTGEVEEKTKKRKHDEEETAEEKAERKRKKKEEKAAKKAKTEKRNSKAAESDSDSD